MAPKNILFFSFFLFIIYLPVCAQEHPHILVNNNDKSLILNKIEQKSWAGTIYREIEKNITPYVERHKTEPEWILSRYLMNRVPGKHYTKAFSDKGGLKLVRWAGDAPVPTVRVSSHIRGPVTLSGLHTVNLQ